MGSQEGRLHSIGQVRRVSHAPRVNAVSGQALPYRNANTVGQGLRPPQADPTEATSGRSAHATFALRKARTAGTVAAERRSHTKVIQKSEVAP